MKKIKKLFSGKSSKEEFGLGIAALIFIMALIVMNSVNVKKEEA